MVGETLSAFFAARTDWLPCTSGYAYTVKLCKLTTKI